MSSSPDPSIGFRLLPQEDRRAICFFSSVDKPFLLSKVAGSLTVHGCHIIEADIRIRNGFVADVYKIIMPEDQAPLELEERLFQFMNRVMKGEVNIESSVFDWEKNNLIIQDTILPNFKEILNDRAVLSITTSNKKGILHKIAWALSLAGVNIERATINATGSEQAEDTFWIRQRKGEEITPQYQGRIRDLLRMTVSEGQDPIEQPFKKELNMIYRQQLRRQGSGFRTAGLYANAHVKLIENLFYYLKAELDIEDDPLIIGLYGGFGSGAIGFTSDIDCIFLYDGPIKEEYDVLKKCFIREMERITELDVDESFLPYHINYFYLSRYRGDSLVSIDDFLDYVKYIDDLRTQTGKRFFEPQFFHFPWAFSFHPIGSGPALERFNGKIRKAFTHKKKVYHNIKSWLVREKSEELKGDYVSYLKGKFFPHELGFMDTTPLKKLYRTRNYQAFIEAISPYGTVKYLFRRGVFPLLHLIHRQRRRTDRGLLNNEYKHIRPAVDFMLKCYNVRKTLFITGWWDPQYFTYIMRCSDEREFCWYYLKQQDQVIEFTKKLIAENDPVSLPRQSRPE